MKKIALLLILIALILVPVQTVLADDEPGFTIGMNRDFGYGGMGQIQGNFSIIVKDDLNFVRVVFMMDDVEMGALTEEPFRFRFVTDNYPAGWHEYWAIGELPDGTLLESNRIGVEVLSKEDAGKDTIKIFVILFGGMAVVGLISMVVTRFVSKKVETGEYFGADHLPKGYGLRGGTICPKCGKPYAYHVFSANLLTHKFDRCPHCGKYAVTRPVLRDQIIAKVVEFVKDDGIIPENQALTEEEKLRSQLEKSKYID